MNQPLDRDDVLLAGFAFLTTIFYWWSKGFRLRLIGGAEAAIEQCQSITAEGLSHFVSRHFLYAGFQLPYCGVSQLTGGNVVVWIGLQIVMWMMSVVLIYRTGRLLVDRRAGIVAGVSLTLLWETFRFAVRPQSDMAFIFVLAFALWALAAFHYNSNRRNLTFLTVGLVLLTITRPVGFPIVVLLLAHQFISGDSDLIKQLGPKLTGVVLLAVLVVGALVVKMWILRGFSLEYATQEAWWRSSILAVWANGVIVTHILEPTFQYVYDPRPGSSVLTFILLNADHIVITSLMKITWLFIPVLSRWSTFHIVVNILTLIPLIIGTFLGVYLAVRENERRLIRFWVVPLLGCLAPIAVTYVDGGFNYRAPVTLLFALFTGYAVSVLLPEDVETVYTELLT